MNCPNCAAAMRLVEGRGYFVCDYCATFHFPDAVDGQDSVFRLERAARFTCPVCPAQQLEEASIVGRPVEHCTSCRGVLVDNDTLFLVVRDLRARYTRPSEQPTPLRPEEYEREINCPRCARRMETHPYYGPGNVVIDTCAGCTLVWLDHGEIGVIQRAPGSGTVQH